MIEAVGGWLALVVPTLTALAAGSLAAFLTRRSNKESNATNAFNVVVTQLLSVNDSLRRDVEQSKRDISSLQTKYETSQSEVETLRDKMQGLEDTNRMLARQLGQLVVAWPAGAPMPPISDEWQKYVD